MISINTKSISLLFGFNCAVVCFFLAASSVAIAQCPSTLPCNDDVQISLDYSCQAEFHPSILLQGTQGACPYQVRIKDAYDVVVAVSTIDLSGDVTYPFIDASYIGSRWKGEIFYLDANGVEISCWGWFTVEDKLAPEIDCIDDFTVSCKEDMTEFFTSNSSATLCVGNVDLDPSPAFVTYELELHNGTVRPWELINSISVMNVVTGSGSSGFFNIGGQIIPIPNSTGSGTSGVYSFAGLEGVQITDMSSVTITMPTIDMNSNPGLCFDLTSTSFATNNSADNCDNSEVVIISDILDENECGPNGIAAERYIEYMARDANGLTSDTCRFKISYEKISLADVEFPDNYNGVCSNNNTPGTDITGVPTVDGCALSLTDNLCKFNISFTDDTTSTCGSNFKIFRKWIVLDWCDAEYRQSYQTIEIKDEDPPVVICPKDITVDATDGCSGTYIFNPFDTIDLFFGATALDCSEVSFRAEYLTADDRDVDDIDQPFIPMGVLSSGGFSATLQGGQNWIKYIVTDACDNSSECRMEIYVRDSEPPHAVCDQYTVVSLADNGWGRIYGPSLDDGSFDDCGAPVDFQVKRFSTPCVSDANSDRDDLLFGEYVQFCCQESGDTVDVVLRVLDEGGMSSECHVNVVVQDKHNLFNLGCPSPAIITASCNNTLGQLKALYGTPSPINSCGNVPSFIISDNDGDAGDCGARMLTRTWTAVYGQDTTDATCVQRISVTGGNIPLTLSSFNPPTSVVLANCSNYREDQGNGPSLRNPNNNLCLDVGFDYRDDYFYGAEGYCVKVVRHWTAIDFCNNSNNIPQFNWTQTIKVEDTTGPLIDSLSCPGDIELIVGSDSCEVDLFVPLPSATDACTGDPIPASGFTWDVSGVAESGVGTPVDVTLDPGSYTLTWTVTGICGAGATSQCSASVSVRDTLNPSPYCRTSIVTVINKTDAQGEPFADIWASDFDLGSTDNCDNNLQVSFSPTNLFDTQRIFGCHELGFQSLEVYFTDDSGNQEFCVASINIQSNDNICDTVGTRGFRIEGEVYTEDSRMVEEVDVALETMNNDLMGMASTNEAGHFAFSGIAESNTYALQAQSKDDYLNGVSTIDLVMIQRHILGLDVIESPYKLIAADINGSQNINGIDLVELRKLILGVYTELPQNDSWNYVSKSYEFVSPQQPWPFQKDIMIEDLSKDEMDNDFIAVKIGDINGSAKVNSFDSPLTGRDAGINLVTEVHELDAAGNYLIPVYLSEYASAYGMQMALEFDRNISIANIESARINLENGNSIYKDGVLSISYNENDLFRIYPDEALFYLTINASSPVHHTDISLGQSIKPELYTEGYEVIKLNKVSSVPTFVTLLHQNKPNPFTGETTIEFELPAVSPIVLKVLDINGRLVKQYKGEYKKGLNQIVIEEGDLNNDGVYYYQLETENFTATKKMLRIK